MTEPQRSNRLPRSGCTRPPGPVEPRDRRRCIRARQPEDRAGSRTGAEPIVDICSRPAAGSPGRKPRPTSTPCRRCAIASFTRAWAPAAAGDGAAAPRFRPVRRGLRSSPGARPRRGGGAGAVVGTYRLIRRAGRGAARRVLFGGRIRHRAARRLSAARSSSSAAPASMPPTAQRPAMQLLWSGIAAYVFHYDIALMFGCASLPGTDPEALAIPLSYLHHHHLAPPALRPRALPDRYVEMRRLPAGALDPARALADAAAADQGLSAPRRLCRRRRRDRPTSSTPPTSASWSRPISSAKNIRGITSARRKTSRTHGPEIRGRLEGVLTAWARRR